MDQSHASTSPDHSNPAQAQRSIGTNGSSQQAAGMLRTTPIRQRFPIRSKQDGRIEQSPEILREKPPPARSARWREAKGCHAADPMHQKSRTNPPRHRNREIQTGHLDGDRGGRGREGKPSCGGRRCRASGLRRAWWPSSSRWRAPWLRRGRSAAGRRARRREGWRGGSGGGGGIGSERAGREEEWWCGDDGDEGAAIL